MYNQIVMLFQITSTKESLGGMRLTTFTKPVLCVALTKTLMAVGSEDFTCTLFPAPKEKDLSKK